MRTAKLGRWSLWTLAAAVPLGVAAFFVARRRRHGHELDAWWRRRERLRTNGHVEPGRSRAWSDDLFV